MELFLIVVIWLMYFRVRQLRRGLKRAEARSDQWQAAAGEWRAMWWEAHKTNRALRRK